MSGFFSYLSSFFYDVEQTKDPESPVVLSMKPDLEEEEVDYTPTLWNLIYSLENGKNREEKLVKIDIFLEEHPLITLNHERYNKYGLNLIMLAIMHDLKNVFYAFIRKRIYSPEQLREMKNSGNENLVTICKTFKRKRFEHILRTYVRKY